MKSKSALKLKMLSLSNKRKQLVNNYVRKFDIVREICLKNKDEKTLVFNQYNAQTSKLYWHLIEIGLKARVVHSDISKEERDKNLKDFYLDKFPILLSTKILEEGFDLPAISCGIIMAGDATSRQTVQRLGRILRKKKHNSLLFQIYCKNTIEEEQAIERAKTFKELASHYGEYNYKLSDKEFNLGSVIHE
jgi:superfamily II DNA or RNA helicase